MMADYLTVTHTEPLTDGFMSVTIPAKKDPAPAPVAELTEQDPARFAVEDLTHWVARTLDVKLSKAELRPMVGDVLKGYAALRESYRQASSARDHWMRKASEAEEECRRLRAEADASLSLVKATAAAVAVKDGEPLTRLRSHLLDAFVALHDHERGATGGQAHA